MSRPATSRLKVNPPLGNLPALQYLLPAQLHIDPAYQRSLDSGKSQTLIRRIAQYWNWDLCQPLVVARRDSGDLFVIDGQHRLAAARLRGDISQLPAVVVQYASQADEAASFVHLNQQRRPLTKLDVFKAAVASGDEESCAIIEAMEEAGLTLAPHSNHTAWKPGAMSNIGGIQQCWRRHGPAVTATALRVIAQAYAGQVLQYAGTLFPGVAAVCADEMANGAFKFDRLENFIKMLGRQSQKFWRSEAMRARAEADRLGYSEAIHQVLRTAWARFCVSPPTPAPPKVAQTPKLVAPAIARPSGVSREFKPDLDGMAWCEQCDRRVSKERAQSCNDRFCPMRLASVA